MSHTTTKTNVLPTSNDATSTRVSDDQQDSTFIITLLRRDVLIYDLICCYTQQLATKIENKTGIIADFCTAFLDGKMRVTFHQFVRNRWPLNLRDILTDVVINAAYNKYHQDNAFISELFPKCDELLFFDSAKEYNSTLCDEFMIATPKNKGEKLSPGKVRDALKDYYTSQSFDCDIVHPYEYPHLFKDHDVYTGKTENLYLIKCKNDQSYNELLGQRTLDLPMQQQQQPLQQQQQQQQQQQAVNYKEFTIAPLIHHAELLFILNLSKLLKKQYYNLLDELSPVGFTPRICKDNQACNLDRDFVLKVPNQYKQLVDDLRYYNMESLYYGFLVCLFRPFIQDNRSMKRTYEALCCNIDFDLQHRSRPHIHPSNQKPYQAKESRHFCGMLVFSYDHKFVLTVLNNHVDYPSYHTIDECLKKRTDNEMKNKNKNNDDDNNNVGNNLYSSSLGMSFRPLSDSNICKPPTGSVDFRDIESKNSDDIKAIVDKFVDVNDPQQIVLCTIAIRRLLEETRMDLETAQQLQPYSTNPVRFKGHYGEHRTYYIASLPQESQVFSQSIKKLDVGSYSDSDLVNKVYAHHPDWQENYGICALPIDAFQEKYKDFKRNNKKPYATSSDKKLKITFQSVDKNENALKHTIETHPGLYDTLEAALNLFAFEQRKQQQQKQKQQAIATAEQPE